MVGEKREALKTEIVAALDNAMVATERRTVLEHDPRWIDDRSLNMKLTNDLERAKRLERDARAVLVALIDEALRA